MTKPPTVEEMHRAMQQAQTHHDARRQAAHELARKVYDAHGTVERAGESAPSVLTDRSA